MKNYKGCLTVGASVATILAVCLAAVALVPAFGQWLFPITNTSRASEMSSTPQQSATTTSTSTELPTVHITPSNTVAPENTATSIPTSPPLPPTDVPTAVSLQPAIQSKFDNEQKEGWMVDSGNLTNPGAGGSGGGLDNGCLIWSASASGKTNYYIAPAKYHGDWQIYSELRLDLWSKGGRYFDSGYGIHGDIYIVSGFATAHRMLPYRPPEQWESFVIPLVDDGDWIFGGGATTLADVLVNVTDFQIRAEYGAERDTTGLDNVMLIPRSQE